MLRRIILLLLVLPTLAFAQIAPPPVAARAWLLPLMDALSAKDRGAILTALDAIRGLPR